jgi:hypothetical protein
MKGPERASCPSLGLYYVLETNWQTANQGLCCYYNAPASVAIAADIVI